MNAPSPGPAHDSGAPVPADLGTFDIVVVGGGINGCAVAREAAYRGYKVALFEQHDFAQATSSQSSKLIHGGIRYLETGEFKLVWESLHERRNLLRIAPHLVKPLELIIPIYRGSVRPPWLVRLGTILYDLLAGPSNLGRSRTVTRSELAKIPFLRQEGLRGAVAYYDAQALDSRLTLETALSARDAGALVRNYSPVTAASLEGGAYRVQGDDLRTGGRWTVSARCVVNATGPWAPFFERRTLGHEAHGLIYDRGIHFVIPSLGMTFGLALMASDKRLIFVLPWREKYTLIGTTESRFEGEDFTNVPPSDAEIAYLLDSFNEFFPERNLKLGEVLHIYSGVRTLMKGEGSISALSRESEVKVLCDAPGTAWVMLYGGKLTSHRSYAVDIVRRLRGHVRASGPGALGPGLDTATEPLPGGGAEPADVVVPPHTAPQQIEIWRKRYGSRWGEVARRAANPAAAETLVPSHCYTRADLEFMVDEELAFRLDDLILRRTKLLYDMTDAEKTRLAAALNEYLGSPVAEAGCTPLAKRRA